jgi:O-antigen/teichoic acid export membrane protein
VSVVDPTAPDGRRILGLLSWQGLSMLVQAVTQIGVVAFLARFLSPLEFGLVAAANILVTFVQVLSEGGIGASIVQRPALSETFIGTALTVSLLISTAFYLVILLAAVPFQMFFKMDGLAAVVVALGLGSFFAGAGSIIEGALQRELRFAALSRVTLIASLAGYALPAIALALAGAGVWALVVGTLGGGAARLVLLLWTHGGKILPGWERNEARDVFRFGIGLTQDRFWNWLSAQSGPVVIGTLFGQAQLGQFYMASRLAILPAQYLSTVVSAVYFPLMSRLLSDKKLVTEQFLKLFSAVFIAMTAVGLLLAVNADFVVRVALGGGWDEAVVVFQILCLGAGLRSSTQICDALNIALGRVQALANRRALAAIVMFGLIYLVQERGLPGAAWATNVGHGLMLLLTMGLVGGGLRLKAPDLLPCLGPLLAALLLIGLANAIAVYGQQQWMLRGLSLLTFATLINGIAGLVVAMLLSGRFRSLILRRFDSRSRLRGD